ncbi:MAG: hypothetical protein MR424_00530 [Treponema sp.]|nr:hypothetical protein [Treponema sp.]
MKKIILAVASLLALGMLVSCKQEVSGNLTVTDIKYDAFQATTETYYYKVTGSVKNVKTTTVTSKASESATETTGYKQTLTADLNVSSSNPVVTVTVSKDPTTNVTTYTINLPALEGKYKMVEKNGTNPESTRYGSHTQVASDADATDDIKPKTITKIGSTLYYENMSGEQIVIEGFDPTAATLDLSKIPEKGKTTTSYSSHTVTATGEYYTSKTVVTEIPTNSFIYTKL